MSQRAVENTLGRLITDSNFRREFLASPMTVCREFGLDLTTVELGALLRINLDKVQSLAGSLDPRIVRSATASFRGRISLPREQNEADPPTGETAPASGEADSATNDIASAARNVGRRRDGI